MVLNLLKFDMDNANNGLPEHLFKYISSITPLINIDLVYVILKKVFYCLGDQMILWTRVAHTWRNNKI